MKRAARWIWMAGLLVAAGCGNDDHAGNLSSGPPTPTVKVAMPEKRALEDSVFFTGNLAGVEKVEIRARVQGFVDAIHFLPDSRVEAGDLLFTIDPAPYEALVAAARADLQAAEAGLNVAATDVDAAMAERAVAQQRVDRFDKLGGSGAVTEQEVQDRQAALLVAQANVGSAEARVGAAKARMAAAQAQLETAELNLGYTAVKAPIGGRIGRNLVDLGALVGTAGDPTLLTTIVNAEEVFAYFTASETDLLSIRRWRYEQGRSEFNPRENIPAFMGLPDEVGYPTAGYFDAAENEIDPSTGTMIGRARFKNPTGLLIPGAYARVRIPLQKIEAMVIPAVAVSRDQSGPFVLSVGTDKIVARHSVTLGLKDGNWVQVTGDLPAEEAVITQGLLLARPGSAVVAQPDERFAAKNTSTKP